MEKNAIDPVGCGDALIAYASLALYISKNPVIASIIGSVSASLMARINGNISISKKDVREKLATISMELKHL